MSHNIVTNELEKIWKEKLLFDLMRCLDISLEELST